MPAGWFEVIRGPRPLSVQRSASVNLSIPCAIRGAVLQRLRLRNQLRCKVHKNSPEEIQASAQASIIRLERALAFLDESDVIARKALEDSLKRARSGGNSPCARPHKVVRGVCASCSETSFSTGVVVTGAVEHRDRMKVEFEEGQRRLANLQAEAQRQLWGRWWPKSTDPVLLKNVLVCASGCPRLQGLGSYRPCRHSCQESSLHGWRI